MQIQYHQTFDPELECIFLLERRFHPNQSEPHCVEDLCNFLSQKYNIPLAELTRLCKPFADIESQVNDSLAIPEDRLRFFFTIRNSAHDSLGRIFLPLLRARASGTSGSHEQELDHVVRRLLGSKCAGLESAQDWSSLSAYLLETNCAEDVKWLCTAMFLSLDRYLEECASILTQASALLQSCLPNTTELCRDAISGAKVYLGADPTSLLHHPQNSEPIEKMTVYPCLMDFCRIQWYFSDQHLYYGVLYNRIGELVSKYSDMSTVLVSKLRSMGDKNRLEILRMLKDQQIHGQSIADILHLAPTTISHHLSLLYNEGFLNATNKGTRVYYELNPQAVRDFLRALENYLL